MTEQEKALALCKGEYQRNLVLGRETLGGSSLKGAAKKYAAKYNFQAKRLVDALTSNDIKFTIQPGPHGGWYSSTLKFEDGE